MAAHPSPRGERERIDTRALCDRVDLLDLIGQYTVLKRVSMTRGGEFAGPCPRCGGSDRLRVQPARGQWMCRSCHNDEGKWSNAIGFVMWLQDVPFLEACEILGATPASTVVRPARPLPEEPEPEDEPEPSPAWRTRAEAFVSWAETQLWALEGEWARRYLMEWRGLSEETMRRWRLGWCPRLMRDAPTRWGLPPAARPVLLDVGIVLPWFVDGHLWQVKIRRLDPAAPSLTDADLVADPKYRSIAGGHAVLYGADTLTGQSAAFMVEGEFDALLLHQEAGDLAGVVTLGGCNKRPGVVALSLLLPVSRLLVAYDEDMPGQLGADRLMAGSRRMRRVRVPSGHDVTDAWRRGADLHAWASWSLGNGLTLAPDVVDDVLEQWASARVLTAAEVAAVDAMPIVDIASFGLQANRIARSDLPLGETPPAGTVCAACAFNDWNEPATKYADDGRALCVYDWEAERELQTEGVS